MTFETIVPIAMLFFSLAGIVFSICGVRASYRLGKWDVLSGLRARKMKNWTAYMCEEWKKVTENEDFLQAYGLADIEMGGSDEKGTCIYTYKYLDGTIKRTCYVCSDLT
jgi:hypothetical protein